MNTRIRADHCKCWLIVMILSLIIIVSGCGNTPESGANTSDTEQEISSVMEPDTKSTSESGTEDAADTDQNDQKTDSSDSSNMNKNEYPIAFTAQTTWGEEGNYGGTYNVSFTNQSSSEVNAWNIEAEVPDGSKVSEAWGCEVQIQGTTAQIKASDWGAKVAAGQKMDVGFNMDSPSLFSPSVKALYVDGKPVGAGGSVASVNNEEPEKDESDQRESDPKESEKSSDNNSKEKPLAESGTPVSNHGALSVKGTDLVDQNGKIYQLKGVSTHGLAWFPEYVNKDAFQSIRDDWGGNVIRLAMYSDENGGYCSGGDQAALKQLVESGVDAATELGMYVIIDWHVLGEQDPLRHKDEAKQFFDEMSKKYASYDNVLYEICNEPNGGATWSGNVRPYAEAVIPVIRANDKDAVIIVGTPTWSQDVDVVANDVISHPIPDAGNVMYALHFYAATHTDSLRNKLTTARNQGLPIFISECSICDASGNGGNDYNQAEKWFDLINDNQLSYCCWSLCNKDETSALISSGCSKTSGWSESDLSETGKWIRKKMRGN